MRFQIIVSTIWTVLIFLTFCLSAAAKDRGFEWVNELPETAHPGLSHDTFHSSLMDLEVGYVVYLPPGYDDPENSGLRYPVVYYLHGGREGSEIRDIRMVEEFDRRIKSGVVPPRIYVFVNGGRWSHYDHRDSYGETAFVDELIPHVDRNYRTIASRSGRGVEGFAEGGRGAARIMLRHPELFCSAVLIGGGHEHEKHASENKGEVWLGGSKFKVEDRGNNTWDLALQYAKQGDVPLVEILVVVGSRDYNYEANLAWMEHLESLGIPFENYVISGVPHNAGEVYEHVGDQVMRFHERCFAAGEAP